MNTIKFNNHSYGVYSFSKNTYFNDDGISSNANCSIETNDITSLHELAQEGIQTLQIYHDDTLIYNLSNLDGKLTSIDEYLSDDRVNINLNLNFSVTIPSSNEEEN